MYEIERFSTPKSEPEKADERKEEWKEKSGTEIERR